MSSTVPNDVRALLEGPVNSFEKLELLVAVAATAETPRSPRALAEQLKVDLQVVQQCVIDLERGGLIHCDQQGLVCVRSPESVASLVAAYDQDRLAVVTILSEIAMRRIRGLTARAFANAFDLMKKRGGDG